MIKNWDCAGTGLGADCGVAVVLVPEVTGTGAYGATRWLTPEKAILQLSLRGKTEDFLWFTLFHEAAHILKHGKKDVFIDAPEGTADVATQKKEEEANAFATDFLIPREAHRDLIALRPFTTAKIIRFAERLGIAPGLIARIKVGSGPAEGIYLRREKTDSCTSGRKWSLPPSNNKSKNTGPVAHSFPTGFSNRRGLLHESESINRRERKMRREAI